MRARLPLLPLGSLLLTGALFAQQSAPPPSAATKVARAVDPKVLRAHLEFLADDALEGRAPGTRGGEAAAKYIAAQFRRLGLEPAAYLGDRVHVTEDEHGLLLWTMASGCFRIELPRRGA